MSTSNLGRDLGPYQHLRGQRDQLNTYVALVIEKGPDAAVQKLRQLHRNTSLGQENSDFYAWADIMVSALRDTTLLSRDVWRKLIRADIVTVYLDIMMRSDFWLSPWYFCSSIVDGSWGIVKYARQYKDPVAVNALLSRTSDLWRSVWERKEQLKSLRTYLDRDAYSPEPIVRLLGEYADLCIDQRNIPPFETYMPDVGLHVWLKYGDESPVLATIRNAVLCLMTTSEEGCRRFFREAGVSGATAEAAVTGIKRELMRAQNATAFVHLTPLLFAFTNCHDLFPFYATSSLLSEVSHLLTRIRDGPGTREEKINGFMLASRYLGEYTPLAHKILNGESSGTLALQGDEVVSILALGVDLLAADGGARVENDMDTDFCEDLDRYIVGWTRSKVYEEADDSTGLLVRSLFGRTKARARLDWWPILHRIQTTVDSRTNIGPLMKKLAADWAKFGEGLGLDPAKERARHEKESQNRCNWRACQHHREKPDDVVLSKCKGCGVARYCGRECQKIDWTKGGHKWWCKRLK